MSFTIARNPHVFGLPSPLPLRGFPPGRVRLRLRYANYVIAFVKSADGIREFFVKEDAGHWVPGLERARNHRPATATV